MDLHQELLALEQEIGDSEFRTHSRGGLESGVCIRVRVEIHDFRVIEIGTDIDDIPLAIPAELATNRAFSNHGSVSVH
jgi:hypothetical protein